MEVLEVLSPGLGAALQDFGQVGWRRFGVPPGGVMDGHAAGLANQLLDNPPTAPVLEMMWQGGHLRVLRDTWMAVTGADVDCGLAMWRPLALQAGTEVRFPRHRSGVWVYVAVEHGFVDGDGCALKPGWLGGGLGKPLVAGDRLHQKEGPHFRLPEHVAGRVVRPSERWDYEHPPVLRVWPGPQWEEFAPEERERFWEAEWTVTSRSNRVGYRLEGPALAIPQRPIISEPVRVGSVQVPEGGQPIVTMQDGPTVGGYPKLGLVDPLDLARLAQCGPGRTVRFCLAT